MSTLAERISECIADRVAKSGQSQSEVIAEVARICGIKPPSVYDWLNGNTKKLQGMNLLRSAEYFGVGPNWLDSGAGKKLATPIQAGMENLARVMTGADDPLVFVPVLSVRGSMGPGSENHVERVDDHHGYSRKWLDKKGLHAPALRRIWGEGRSMEPTIFDGDVVLINTAEKKIVDGKVYAFLVGDELRIKRLYRQMDGKIRAASDNADKATFPDEFLTPDHMPEMVGRVVDRSGAANL